MSVRLQAAVGAVASALLVAGSAAGSLPFGLTEVFGFVTGGLAVWLVVKENVWTWPVGIANNVLFVVLFWRARLYADMGLQWVYVAISLAGWWYWLRGGAARTRRLIGRASARELAAVVAAVVAATVPLTLYLRSIDDSAPFLDALTTALSLGAMYLMARKLVENWWLWIAADVVYIPLYAWKGLPLTGLLYAIFLAMCIVGVRDWLRRVPPRTRGVVIGKFDPPHRGHLQLIDTALAQADDVAVVVCAKRSDAVPGDERVEQLARLRPKARVVLVDQDRLGLADDDTAGWASVTQAVVGARPDVVCTGEDYGDGFAELLGARHVRVSKAIPISSTKLRGDAAATRAQLVRRVCILGAESTGKSTLAAALAEEFETVWVPEYGRVYTEVGRDPAAPWTSDEFTHIARVHRWYEDFLAGYAKRVLFCDTDAFVTARFHDAYLGGYVPAPVEELVATGRYDLFVLCDIDTPFVQDGCRMDGAVREAMHADYVGRLQAGSTPWIEVRGTPAERVEQAVRAVRALVDDPSEDRAVVGVAQAGAFRVGDP